MNALLMRVAGDEKRRRRAPTLEFCAVAAVACLLAGAPLAARRGRNRDRN